MSVKVQPESYQIFLQAFDDLSNELHPNVWIDDNWVGTAPISCYSASIGEHTVEVDDQVGDANFFQFSEYPYTNPLTIDIESSNMYLFAGYWYQ